MPHLKLELNINSNSFDYIAKVLIIIFSFSDVYFRFVIIVCDEYLTSIYVQYHRISEPYELQLDSF